MATDKIIAMSSSDGEGMFIEARLTPTDAIEAGNALITAAKSALEEQD